jgi:hypothetical protein
MWNDKPDGYPIPTQNPMGTGTDMNFYPRVRVQISTRSLFAGGRVIALPDLNPTHCHPYRCGPGRINYHEERTKIRKNEQDTRDKN